MKISTLLINSARSQVLFLAVLCCLAMKPGNVFSQTITTGAITSPLCSGAAVSVPFTSTGATFTGGNVFTAQLSNASGVFTPATTIGTLTSTANSGTINATIPVTTAAGTLYRIRVISSTPSITGSEVSNITINPGPGIITVSPVSPIIDCYGSLNSLTATSESQTSGATPIDVHGTFEGAGVGTYWTENHSSSTGGNTTASAWTLQNNGYIYSVQHTFFFFFRYFNDYTFNTPNPTQFYLSNSSAQGSGTTRTTLTTTTPANLLNTTGYTSLTLNFFQNLRVRNNLDTAAVQVNTGAGWITVQKFNTQQGIETQTGTTGSFFGGNLHIQYNETMQQASVDLTPYINTVTNTMLIRFAYGATSGSSDFLARDNWWAIDSLKVTGSKGATVTPRITWGPIDGNLYVDAIFTDGYDSLNAPHTPTVYGQIVRTNPATPQTYFAVAQIGNCKSTSSPVSLTVSSNYTWTGIYDSNWNNFKNWCSGNVPAGGDDNITIPSGTPFSPKLTTANGIVQAINIAAGTTVDLNGRSLSINGPISGNGTLTGSHTSGVSFGDATGTVYFTPNSYPGSTTNNYLKSLTLTGSTITLGDSLNITAGTGPSTFGTTSGTLTVASGSTFITSDSLTLKSNQWGDARVGQLSGASGNITGKVVVERYVPAKRAWRFMAIPFSSSTQTINQAWQEGVSNADATLNYANNLNPKPGFGTHITYTSTAGYDYNTTTNPSIKVWNPAANGWSTSIPATSTNIAGAGNLAYCLFVRGSRAVNLAQATSAAADNTTLRIRGDLNTGTISKSYPTTAANKVLIGNPYASAINILTVLSTNGAAKFTQNKFWVWDPRYAGTYGVGGYITYNGSLTVPGGSSYAGGTNAQSGQAFMLEAVTTGTTSVSFTESCKITSQASVFRTAAKPQKHPAIFTNLVLPSGELLDGVGAGFGKQYAVKVDNNDATKLWNIDENIALVRDEATLAIEARPVPLTADTLFFRLYLRQQPYALKIFSQDLPENLPGKGKVWLVDKYLNTQTEVNPHDTTLYNFTPNTDTNSYRNRFMLVISPERVTKVAKVANPGSDNTGSGNIQVYPNPIATGAKAVLKFDAMPKGNYEITVSNNAGNIIKKKTFVHVGGSSTYDIQTGSGWVTGNYVLKITGEKGYSFSTNLVVGK